MKKTTYLKVFILCTVFIVAITFGWFFLTQYSSQSRASQDIATISYDSTTLPQNENEEADVQIQIETPRGVSAFNIVVEASEGLVFDSIGESIQAVPLEKSDTFSKVLTYTSEDRRTGKVAYAVISGSDEELAKIVSIPANIINTSGTDGELVVIAKESEVTGPEGLTYALETDHVASSDGSSDSSPSSDSLNNPPGLSDSEGEQGEESDRTETDASRVETNRKTEDESETTAPLANTGSEDGPVKLTVLVRFQGTGGDTDISRDTLEASLSIMTPSEQRITRSTVFTYRGKGVWEGSTSFPETVVGSPVSVLIKGAKHIQRKICDDDPTEETEGRYVCQQEALNLSMGPNEQDFSGIVLFAGDVTGSSGVQDGLVDSSDLAFIRNNMGTEQSDIIQQADLNMDGRIDTQDYGLITATLSQVSTNTDEE